MKKIVIVFSMLVFSLLNVSAGERDVKVRNGETYQEVLHINSNTPISWRVGFTYNPQDPSIPGYGLAYFYDMQTGEGDDLFFRSHIDGNIAQTTYGYKRYWHDVILYIHADQQTYGGLFIEWGM